MWNQYGSHQKPIKHNYFKQHNLKYIGQLLFTAIKQAHNIL